MLMVPTGAPDARLNTAMLAGMPIPPDAEPLSSDALHAVFTHLARALARDRPVVWIVEDLHFATADARLYEAKRASAA